MASLSRQLQSLQSERSALEERNAELESLVRDLLETQLRPQQTMQALTLALVALNVTLSAPIGDLVASLASERQSLSSLRRAASRAIDDLESRNSVTAAEKMFLLERNRSLERQKGNLEAQCAMLRSQVESMESTVQPLVDAAEDLEVCSINLETLRAAMAAQKAATRARIAELEAEIRRVDAEVGADLGSELQAAMSRLATVTDTNVEVREMNAKPEVQIATTSSSSSSSNEELDRIEKVSVESDGSDENAGGRSGKP